MNWRGNSRDEAAGSTRHPSRLEGARTPGHQQDGVEIQEIDPAVELSDLGMINVYRQEGSAR